MAIKIQRQTASASSASPPSTLPYGELACDKTAVLYVGNSSNYPVKMMDTNSYNQVGNPNLLDNGDFLNPVNQRGLYSVTKHGYFIDRWEVGYSNPVVAKVDTSGFTITAGSESVTLRQTIDNTNVQNEYTLSICTSTGEIFSVTGVPTTEKIFTTSFGNMRIGANNGRVNVMFVVVASKTMSLKWAKLEKGSVATPYVPKGYGVELAECLRYFQRVHADWRIYPTLKDMLYRFSQSTLQVMRIKPTISAHSTPYTFGCTINALDAQPMAFTVETKITEQGQNSAAASMLGYFDLSADL